MNLHPKLHNSPKMREKICSKVMNWINLHLPWPHNPNIKFLFICISRVGKATNWVILTWVWQNTFFSWKCHLQRNELPPKPPPQPLHLISLSVISIQEAQSSLSSFKELPGTSRTTTSAMREGGKIIFTFLMSLKPTNSTDTNFKRQAETQDESTRAGIHHGNAPEPT